MVVVRLKTKKNILSPLLSHNLLKNPLDDATATITYCWFREVNEGM